MDLSEQEPDQETGLAGKELATALASSDRAVDFSAALHPARPLLLVDVNPIIRLTSTHLTTKRTQVKPIDLARFTTNSDLAHPSSPFTPRRSRSHVIQLQWPRTDLNGFFHPSTSRHLSNQTAEWTTRLTFLPRPCPNMVSCRPSTKVSMLPVVPNVSEGSRHQMAPLSVHPGPRLGHLSSPRSGRVQELTSDLHPPLFERIWTPILNLVPTLPRNNACSRHKRLWLRPR